MNKKIITGVLAVVVLAVVGYVFMTNNTIETEEIVSTQPAPTEEVVEEVVDTRTPEQILDEEGSVEVMVKETPEESEELPTTESSVELVGGDAVAPEVTPGETSFTVLGSNFEYDITEMRVQEGDTVTVTFRSVDGFHDWVVDEFNAATEKVSTGNETTVTFVADKAGTYEYYCSVGSHRANGMVGTLIVE